MSKRVKVMGGEGYERKTKWGGEGELKGGEGKWEQVRRKISCGGM